MKKFFALVLLCLIVGTAQISAQEKTWTAKLTAEHCFNNYSYKKNYAEYKFDFGIRGALAKKFKFNITKSGGYFEPQLATSVMRYRFFPTLYAGQSENYHLNCTQWGLSPSFSLGYNWRLGKKMSLDYYLGVEYQFTLSDNHYSEGGDALQGVYFRTGFNLHLNDRWLTNIEFAPQGGTNSDGTPQSRIQRLSLGVGYKF